MLRDGENSWRKTVGRVAGGAIRVFGLGFKLPVVGIVVASRAGVERQRLDKIGNVAILAIDRNVFADERKIRPSVVKIFRHTFDFETFLRVASLAIGTKFSFVGVFVAGRAVRRFHAVPILKNRRRRHTFIYMTLGAVDLPMFADERKIGFRVVELSHAFKNLKTLLRVASLAVGADFAAMRVGVAGIAICKSDSRKFLKILAASFFLWVALDATHVAVLAEQNKVGFRVVKFRGRRKTFGCVAVGAFFSQRVLVVIGVAARTIGSCAEEGFFSFFQFGVVHKIRFVALSAVNGFVLSAEFVARFRVVERLFVQPDHVEIFTVMLAVALRAIFRPRLLRRVKALARRNARLDFFVAIETLAVGYFFADFVAFRAVSDTFEIRVVFRQFAGRELGGGVLGEKEQQKAHTLQGFKNLARRRAPQKIESKIFHKNRLAYYERFKTTVCQRLNYFSVENRASIKSTEISAD